MFVDDDGRVYLYYGCSNVEPLHAVELDPQKRLEPIGKPVDVIEANPKEHGWERPGDRNELDTAPWLEGAWMNKVQDKYYLQYAAPGTEYKSYADGVYVSDRPLGPFSYAPNSPFSRKPAGFIAGAGHGSTFADEYGNHWHIATMSISVAHKFERRLGLFPTLFSENGVHTVTEFGDFPMRMPTMKFSQPDEVATGWMLLSHAKSATASSSFVGTSVTNAVDEDVRTHWAAKSGGAGEWISVDLGRAYCVRALQINLGEQDSTILGPNAQASQYVVESSLDARSWTLLLDRGDATVDLPHFYQQLETPVRARFVRVTNKRVPSGKFTVSGLRVFGNGQGARPARVQNLSLVRSESDRRTATLSWDSVAGVTGYNVRFGNTEHALFQSHTVFGRNALELNSLDAGTSYWFAVDAFNENGVTRATQLTKVE